MFRRLSVVSVVLATTCAPGPKPTLAPRQPSAMSSLIPQPASVEMPEGEPFTVSPDSVIVVPPHDARAAFVGRFLADLIATATVPPPKVVPDPPGAGAAIVLAIDPGLRPEHYTLTVAASGVQIRGGDAAGLFYGVQTLRQHLPVDVEYEASRPKAVTVRPLHVVDGPRFGWRGAMLDVARHFFDVGEVQRYIDLVAMLKLNRLHLHLSDDQGWRIEIKSWPRLTAHGGSTEVGGGSGGFYTQAQYTEIVQYANERFITIVPEIDMPGHTNAALASYAELNCDGKAREPYTGIEVGFSAFCVESETTYTFIDAFVREISALTPGPYFHIGGDEVKTLSPAQYRQFIERVQDIVQSHGKQMVGWDEVSPVALKPTSIVQHWRPKETPKEAVEKGVKIILSPADRVYLDMKYTPTTPIGLNWAAIIEVRDAYEWEPSTYVPGVPEAAVLGIEAPLWTETVASLRDLEFLAFPRLAAVAEIAWSRPERRGWDDFASRLGRQAPRWSALGINFYRSPQVPWQH
ncbi:MAG TPA: beta-N-acetylhexosaminidase [Vicinamibacterales bacterium]|nr:beta-N-acetylhexosaminidase [Vicinamibacterales bacterium]